MTDVAHVADEVTPEQHKRLRWALVLISLAQLMVVLDSTIANIALPYIGRDLGIGQANLQWIVTGYALTFGGFLLLGGRLADLMGRRRIFIAGVLLFAVASLVGGAAQNEAMLLGARAFQGLGAAMAGVGAAVGLILGGWLTGLDHPLSIAGWRYTFLIVVPIGLAAAFFAPRFFDESERHEGELDVPGAITGTAGLLAIVFGLSRAGQEAYGWDATSTVTSLVLGVLLLALFIIIETRVEHPLLPFRIFSSRNRAVAFAVMMIVPAAMFAMFFFLSLFIQLVVGYSPLHTGFAFLPFSIAMIISATTASKLISSVDPRFLSGVGTLLSATALFGFSRLDVPQGASEILGVTGDGGFLGDGVNYWTQILPFIVLMAFGMGLNFVPLTLVAVHRLRAQDSGVGSGVLNTMQQVGGALGLATLSTVALHFTTARAGEVAPQIGAAAQGRLTSDQVGQLAGIAGFADGATHAFLVGSVMMLVASAIVWLFLDVHHDELATDGAPEGVAVH
jgi:MFS family permease